MFFFFFNDTATTEIYSLSLHDALPISGQEGRVEAAAVAGAERGGIAARLGRRGLRRLWCQSRRKIGRAACRGRGEISVVGGSLKKKKRKKDRTREIIKRKECRRSYKRA